MRHWIFPANWEQFDVLGAFAKYGMLDWRKNCTAEIGDLIYLYYGAPIHKIVLKAKVVSNDISKNEIVDDRTFSKVTDQDYEESLANTEKFLRLKPLKCFLHFEDRLSLNTLREHGLKQNIQGPQILENNPELFKYILSIEDT